MWETEGWAWRSQNRTAVAESISDCFTAPPASVFSPSVPSILCEVSLFSPLFHSLGPVVFFHFHFFFCLNNRNVQSFFNGARHYISSGLVQYCCPLCRQRRCFLKKKKKFCFPIAVCFSVSVFTLLLSVKRRARSNKLNNKLKERHHWMKKYVT